MPKDIKLNGSMSEQHCIKSIGRVLTSALIVPYLVLGFSACSDDNSEMALVTESVGLDGVREIVSRAVEPCPEPWILEADLVIGVEFGDEEYMLRAPRDYLVTTERFHVILDSNPVQLRIFSADGEFIRAFGQEGQGPTDLIRLSRMLHQSGNSTFDVLGISRPFRLQSWTIDGTFLDYRTLKNEHPLYANYVFDWDGELLYAIGYDFDRSPARRWSNILTLASDWEGNRVDTLAIVSHLEMTRGAGMAQASMDFSPGDITLLTSSGWFLYSQLEEDWIHVLAPGSWREEFRFRREHEPNSIPDWVITDITENNPERYREEIAEGGKWLQERISAFGMAEGPNGEIWVQRTAWTDESNIRVVDIFSENGVFRGQIGVPFHLWTMKMAGRYLYAISETGEALALVRYRVRGSN